MDSADGSKTSYKAHLRDVFSTADREVGKMCRHGPIGFANRSGLACENTHQNFHKLAHTINAHTQKADPPIDHALST